MGGGIVDQGLLLYPFGFFIADGEQHVTSRMTSVTTEDYETRSPCGCNPDGSHVSFVPYMLTFCPVCYEAVVELAEKIRGM
jgi:hypothetical protein